MKIHKRLYTYIKSKNISMSEISSVSGISEKRLRRIFAEEECEMALEEYVALCKAVGVPIDYFTVKV
ncbi:MAG: hypothetical protein SOS24_10355 [Clostridia bacterium]|nr:hypothetical protein [Clostridia bacterium]